MITKTSKVDDEPLTLTIILDLIKKLMHLFKLTEYSCLLELKDSEKDELVIIAKVVALSS